MSAGLMRVLTNAHGRYCLWPGAKATPRGWQDAWGPAPRQECLDYVSQTWGRPRVQAPAIEFSLMFFGGDEGTAARDKYGTVIDAARFADAHGFAGVWIPERHFTMMGSLYPNPAVLQAALARETRRLRLRAGSVVLPLHDPIRVAEEWAVVDNLSGGRVEISFAPGWNVEDFVLGPDHYDDRHAVMYAGIETVHRLWRGETIERRDGQGKPFTLRTYPTPVQPRLPTWVTVAGSERSFQQAGRAGVNLLTHLFDNDVDELAVKLDMYRAARQEAGHDRRTGRIAVALHTFVAPTMAEVLARAQSPYCDYLKANRKMIERLAESRGIPLDISGLSAEQLDQMVNWVFEKFMGRRSLLGTPESCAELVQRLAAAGVHEIACLLDFGPSAQAIQDSLPHLARLKDRFMSTTSPN